MVIGSHNSWSYLPAKKWWMTPFKFMAKCQNLNIQDQYNKGVRCFDLRVRFTENEIILAHGFMEYKYLMMELYSDLAWINKQKDCYVRVLLETRTKKQYSEYNINKFKDFCSSIKSDFSDIKFWCGRNLYNWTFTYDFGKEPSCEEKYSSVCAPKLIDDWWPLIFAKRNNSKIKKEGTDKEILLIDFIEL